MPPTSSTVAGRREELELRQLELQIMAQELAVLAQQIHAADQATRAFQAAQWRDRELRKRDSKPGVPLWVSLWIGGVAVGVTMILLSSRSRQ